MPNEELTNLISDIEQMVNTAGEQFQSDSNLNDESLTTLLIASLIEEEFNG